MGCSWFEGLVNAITHRDYSMSGDYIRVLPYDGRLEIISPGKLPNIVTFGNMKYTRWSRDPTIARTLVEFGWVRELNEGVQRIYDEMANFFLNEPKFSEPNDISVQLVLENSITSRMIRQQDSFELEFGAETLRNLSGFELSAMQFLYGRGRATVKELSNYLGRTPRVARATLKSLISKQLVDWHGTSATDPSQFYTLHREEKDGIS